MELLYYCNSVFAMKMGLDADMAIQINNYFYYSSKKNLVYRLLMKQLVDFGTDIGGTSSNTGPNVQWGIFHDWKSHVNQ